MKKIRNCLTLMALTFLCADCSQTKNTPVSKKIDTIHAPLRGTYWKLITLMGQPIPSSSNTLREPHLNFSTNEQTIGGNGGCNTFSGSYQSIDSSQLSFGPVISTKMYCDEAKYENLFFDVLGRIDNYLINGDTLVLRNSGMDSTAKFLAIPAK